MKGNQKMTKEERINEIKEKMDKEGLSKILNQDLVNEREQLSEWWLKLTDTQRQEIVKDLECEDHKKYDRLMYLLDENNLLTELGVSYVNEIKKINEEHEVLEKLKLVKGEIDIRKLTQEDFNQLLWRTLVDQYQIQRNTMMLLSDIAKVLYRIAEKKGINIQNTLDKN